MTTGEQAPDAPKPQIRLSELRAGNQRAAVGEAEARSAINAIGTIAPLLAALIQRPGTSKSHESSVEAAAAMLRSADSATTALIEELGAENIGWARYRVMKSVAMAVAQRWVASMHEPGVGVDAAADVSDLVPVWLELIRNEAVPGVAFEATTDDTRVAIQVALLDAMEPVMREISVFDLMHGPAEAATHAREVIMTSAQAALDGLQIQDCSVASKNQLLQALLRHAGSSYAAAWRNQVEATLQEWSEMDQAGRNSVIEEYREGLPLQGVDEAFIDSFSRLVEMAQYLPPSPRQDAEVSADEGAQDSSPERAKSAKVRP